MKKQLKKNSLLAPYPRGLALTFSLFIYMICVDLLPFLAVGVPRVFLISDRRDNVIKMQTIEYFIVQFKAELLKCCKIILMAVHGNSLHTLIF
jgi:hypothetical protein